MDEFEFDKLSSIFLLIELMQLKNVLFKSFPKLFSKFLFFAEEEFKFFADALLLFSDVYECLLSKIWDFNKFFSVIKLKFN